jgi:hypothetical protein
MNDLFGLTIPVLIEKKESKIKVVTPDSGSGEELVKLIDCEKTFRGYLRDACNGLINSRRRESDYSRNIATNGKLPNGQEIKSTDAGVRNFLDYAIGMESSTQELLELDSEQKKGLARLVKSVSQNYIIEPDNMLVDGYGNLYPNAVLWHQGLGVETKIKNIQNAVTDFMKDGGCIIGYLSEEEGITEPYTNSRNIVLEDTEKQLCTGYVLVSSSQTGLPDPKASLGKMGILEVKNNENQNFRMKLRDLLKGYSGQAVIDKPSIFAQDYPLQARNCLYGEVGRAYNDFENLKEVPSTHDPKVLREAILEKDKLKGRMIADYGSRVVNMLNELEVLYSMEGDKYGRR